MSDETEGTRLTQALDAALAAYQRHYGRPRAMERMHLMLARAYEAQRTSDGSKERLGQSINPRAAE